jgi:lipopolysaccharide exporter
VVNISSKIISGLKWGYISTVLVGVSQLGYTAIMSRMLDAEEYGIMSLALLIILFGRYFSQFGLTQALIQKEKLDNENIESGFSISVLLGLFVYIFFLVLARPISVFFTAARLETVLPILALAFIFNSLSIVSFGLIRRRLAYNKLAIVEVISLFLSYFLIGVPLAYSGFGVWSLVYANVSLAFFQMVLAYSFVRHSLKISMRFKKQGELLQYGGKISIISIFEYFNSNLPVIAIGRLISTIDVGYFNRGNVLGSMIFQNFNQSISRTLFPVFSRIESDLKSITSLFLNSINRVFYVLFPLSIGLAYSSKSLINVVLGDQWTVVSFIFPPIVLSLLINYLNHYFGVLFDSRAILMPKIVSNLILIITFVTGIFLISSNLSLTIIIYVYTIAQLFRFIWSLKVSHFKVGIKIGSILKHLIPGFINGLILWICLFLKDQIPFIRWTEFLDLIINITVGIFVLVLSLFIPLNREFRKEIRIHILPGRDK